MIKTITIPRKYNDEQWKAIISVRPKKILTSNSKLKRDGIFNFTIPSINAKVMVNGKLEIINTCEGAGICKNFCYAGGSGYLFDCSMIKHHRTLNYMINDPFNFCEDVIKEINSKKKIKFLRWNDSGDILTQFWAVYVEIMKRCPQVKFYAYTKMVKFFKGLQAENKMPANLTVVYSFGGIHDSLINVETDRHARIFKNRKDLRLHGYSETYNSDLNAANPKKMKIGLIVHGSAVQMKVINKNQSITKMNNRIDTPMMVNKAG